MGKGVAQTGIGIRAAALAAIFAVALLAPATAQALNLTHTFDTDRQGWLFGGDINQINATFDGAAGVPVGSIKGVDSDDDNTGYMARFIAPAAFSGNLSASAGGTVSFDLAKTGDAATGRTIQLFLAHDGPGVIVLVRQFIPVETMTSFHRYSVALVPSEWEACGPVDDPPCPIASPALFADALADVDRIVLQTDIVNGMGETYHLDNFSVTEPAPTPATPVPIETAPPTTTKKCPTGKKLVVKKGKRKCKRKHKK